MRRGWAWLVFAGSALPFLPALRHGFVDWDDPFFIVKNPALARFDLPWMFTSTLGGHYHPLTWLSLALDRALYGPEAWGVHLTSLLLHAGAAVFFFKIARRLLGGDAPAAVAALLFAAHPLRAESVAWAIERRDVLSGFLYLWTLELWLSNRARAALAAFAASLLAKGMGVTLPLALLLVDGPGLGKKIDAAWLKKAAPFAALALVFGALGLWAQRVNGAALPLTEFSLSSRAAIAAYGLVWYPLKTLWPSGLIPLVPLPKSPSVLAWPYAACAALVLLALAATAAFWRRAPKLAACAVYYGATVGPVLGALRFGPQLVADRYSYLSCLPLALLAGHLSRRAPRAAWAAVVLLAALTVRQVGFWKDGPTLWTRELAVRADAPMAHHFLASSAMARGRFADAERRERDALAADPGYVPARNGLGLALSAQGRFAEALVEHDAALALKPDYWEAANNKGLALARLGRFAEASAVFERAIAQKPDNAGLHGNYALALLTAGKRKEGLERLEFSLRLDPNQPRLAAIYRSLKK